jgi:hypothetical protein
MVTALHSPAVEGLMTKRIVLAICAAVLAVSVTADAAPLTFSVHGTGGSAGPLAGVSDTGFMWVDGTGDADASSLYGFSPTGASGWDAYGSFLLSDLFNVGAEGATLSLSMLLMNSVAPSSSWGDVGFALLISDDAIVAILANARSNGYNYLGDSGPFPPVMLAAASPGVLVNQTAPDLAALVVGGQSYGPGVNPISCGLHCYQAIGSSYTIGSGNYQLLVGQYQGTRAGLALTKAEVDAVPEPATGLMLVMAACGAAARLRRGNKFHTGAGN